MSIFKNKGIIIGVVLVLAVAAWYLMTSNGSQADLTTTQTDTDLSGPGAQIVQTLLSLQAVSLDGTIFSDPAFASLQDLTTAIVPEPVGRPDPFAPISGSVPSAPSAGSASIFKSK
jgi:hypothetical protein